MLPAAPAGLGDLALLLEVFRDKAQLQKHLDAVVKARDEAAAMVKLAGGAEKVRKALEEIDTMKTATMAAADASMREADERVFNATQEAAQIIARAKVDAGAVRDGVEAEMDEAKALMAEARENDKRVEERMHAANEREKELEARAAELARKEADYVARNSALTAREAKLLEALR